MGVINHQRSHHGRRKKLEVQASAGAGHVPLTCNASGIYLYIYIHILKTYNNILIHTVIVTYIHTYTIYIYQSYIYIFICSCILTIISYHIIITFFNHLYVHCANTQQYLSRWWKSGCQKNTTNNHHQQKQDEDTPHVTRDEVGWELASDPTWVYLRFSYFLTSSLWNICFFV